MRTNSLHLLCALFTLSCTGSSGAFERALLRQPQDTANRPVTFDPLLGSWTIDVTYFPGTDSSFTHPGEWHFASVLEGRAVQDVWRVTAPDENGQPGLRGYGTTVRTWDPEIQAWRSTWIGVLNATVTTFIGRAVGSEIRLEPERMEPGEMYRWVFFEIATDSFRWRAESSSDSGATWRVEQAMRARRSRATTQ